MNNSLVKIPNCDSNTEDSNGNREYKQSVWVNPAQVVWVMGGDKYSQFYLSSGFSRRVEMPVDKLVSLLQNNL